MVSVSFSWIILLTIVIRKDFDQNTISFSVSAVTWQSLPDHVSIRENNEKDLLKSQAPIQK